MTNTPEVDAMICPVPGRDVVTGQPIDVVHADDARVLERQRDKARTQISVMRNHPADAADGEFEALGEVKTILQKACDRQWEDETLYQTANIVSNAMYWRNREIERLKANVSALLTALHEIDMYGNGTIDSKDQTAYIDLMRCGSIARAALKGMS